MKVNKFNYKKMEYEKVEKPDEWKLGTNPTIKTLETTINCVNCGAEVRFGSAYSSRIYKEIKGSSYYVCGDCMYKEEKEYRETLPPRLKEKEEIKLKIWHIENKDNLEYNELEELKYLYARLRDLENNKYEINKNN